MSLKSPTDWQLMSLTKRGRRREAGRLAGGEMMAEVRKKVRVTGRDSLDGYSMVQGPRSKGVR